MNPQRLLMYFWIREKGLLVKNVNRAEAWLNCYQNAQKKIHPLPSFYHVTFTTYEL